MQTFRKGLASCIAAVLGSILFIGCVKEGDAVPNQYNANDQDILFASAASVSNYTEVTLAKLDTLKGTDTIPSDSLVKEFAKMMITDHTSADSMLNSVAYPLGLALPDTLDPDHVGLRDQLMTLSGRAFDSVYIHSQVADHQAAVDLYNQEIQKGQQVQLIALAKLLLPTLQSHLDAATTLAADF